MPKKNSLQTRWSQWEQHRAHIKSPITRVSPYLSPINLSMMILFSLFSLDQGTRMVAKSEVCHRHRIWNGEFICDSILQYMCSLHFSLL